jgi:hypothetical protein
MSGQTETRNVFGLLFPTPSRMSDTIESGDRYDHTVHGVVAVTSVVDIYRTYGTNAENEPYETVVRYNDVKDGDPVEQMTLNEGIDRFQSNTAPVDRNA